MLRELLRQKGAAKRDPEFHEAQTELAHKLQWATMMRGEGRLSKSEFEEFESHLTSEYLAALPMDAFVEMTKDGRYAELETIAGHDGKRDRYDVLKDRAAIEKKITEAALDEAWTTGKIGEKQYLEETRKLIGNSDDDRTRRINDADDNKDGEAVALDIFFERFDPPEPEPEPGKAPRLPESIASPPAPAADRIKSADED
jgi:hypothetical protein